MTYGVCQCGQPYLVPTEQTAYLLRGRAIVFYPAEQRARLRCLTCKREIHFSTEALVVSGGTGLRGSRC